MGQMVVVVVQRGTCPEQHQAPRWMAHPAFLLAHTPACWDRVLAPRSPHRAGTCLQPPSAISGWKAALGPYYRHRKS